MFVKFFFYYITLYYFYYIIINLKDNKLPNHATSDHQDTK